MKSVLQNSSEKMDSLIEDYRTLLINKKDRIVLCKNSILLFGLYYFPEFFSHESPQFHYDMCRLLAFNGFQYLIEILYRGSAKTSWAKIKVIHAICYKYKRHIFYGCFESETAESHLYDIAVQLQTNEHLVKDFGQLFYEPEDAQKKSEKKSVKEFITANGVKVKATSVSKSPRGKLYQNFRPDLVILDDFENNKTKDSDAYTSRTLKFIEELITGASADCNILFLCNRISKSGAVAYLEGKAKGNNNWRLFEKQLIENGEITWPAKFVWTNEEAKRINDLVKDPLERVFSIEQMKSDFGTRVFNQEYLNIPVPKEGQLLKEAWIDKHFYSTLPHESKEPFLKVMMMDPQSGESANADEYAIVVVGWFRNDPHRYIIECKSGHGTRTQQAAEFINTWIVHQRNLKKLSIEKVLTQSAVYQQVLDWRNGVIDNKFVINKESKRDIPITPIDPKGRSKISRLEEHEAAFERGEIHLHYGMRALRDQLLDFPHGTHDDMVDALVYCLHFANIIDRGSGFNDAIREAHAEQKPSTIIFTDF